MKVQSYGNIGLPLFIIGGLGLVLVIRSGLVLSHAVFAIGIIISCVCITTGVSLIVANPRKIIPDRGMGILRVGIKSVEFFDKPFLTWIGSHLIEVPIKMILIKIARVGSEALCTEGRQLVEVRLAVILRPQRSPAALKAVNMFGSINPTDVENKVSPIAVATLGELIGKTSLSEVLIRHAVLARGIREHLQSRIDWMGLEVKNVSFEHIRALDKQKEEHEC